MSDVISYLTEKGVPYKPSGSEVIIKCPDCGKDKLSINIENEVFQCFVCKAENPTGTYVKGHFSQLKKYWGILYQYIQ